jgi:hypothetical protein
VVTKPARKRARKDAPPSAGTDANAVGQRLAALGCDPIAVMASIASDESADARLRLAAAKELAAYLISKPRGADAPPSGVDVGAIIAGSGGDVS